MRNIHAIDTPTAMPYNPGMVFIETTLFTKLVYKYLSDEEYITLYAKNEASTISPQVLKRIAEEIKHG